ncbi:hypothetical protein XPA_002219 [Xanthoria parietina]
MKHFLLPPEPWTKESTARYGTYAPVPESRLPQGRSSLTLMVTVLDNGLSSPTGKLNILRFKLAQRPSSSTIQSTCRWECLILRDDLIIQFPPRRHAARYGVVLTAGPRLVP